MKIRYEFIDGEVSEIEVDTELGELLLDLDRQEYNNDHKETRRHTSLSGMDYEGGIFASSANTEREAEKNIDIESLERAKATLSPQQRDLLQKVFIEGRSIAAIARDEGVSRAAIFDRLNRIYKKIRKKL